MYIQAKNFNAAAPIMAKISSPKLQLQYAKAKEAEGRFAEAASAYRAAGDTGGASCNGHLVCDAAALILACPSGCLLR